MKMQEYYQMYLSLHQNKWCRRLHFFGQLATISFVVACFYFQVYFLLLLTPFIVYPFAWSGHYLFEKNEPAAFKDPIRAKASDWIMFKDILLGRIKW